MSNADQRALIFEHSKVKVTITNNPSMHLGSNLEHAINVFFFFFGVIMINWGSHVKIVLRF